MTLTTNSVPRTPSVDAGVRTFMASGDCFAMRPEIIERVLAPLSDELESRAHDVSAERARVRGGRR